MITVHCFHCGAHLVSHSKRIVGEAEPRVEIWQECPEHGRGCYGPPDYVPPHPTKGDLRDVQGEVMKAIADGGSYLVDSVMAVFKSRADIDALSAEPDPAPVAEVDWPTHAGVWSRLGKEYLAAVVMGVNARMSVCGVSTSGWLNHNDAATWKLVGHWLPCSITVGAPSPDPRVEKLRAWLQVGAGVGFVSPFGPAHGAGYTSACVSALKQMSELYPLHAQGLPPAPDPRVEAWEKRWADLRSTIQRCADNPAPGLEEVWQSVLTDMDELYPLPAEGGPPEQGHDWAQIEMAAAGAVSGTLAEWPHLRSALEKFGWKVPLTAQGGTLRAICNQVICTQEAGK